MNCGYTLGDARFFLKIPPALSPWRLGGITNLSTNHASVSLVADFIASANDALSLAL